MVFYLLPTVLVSYPSVNVGGNTQRITLRDKAIDWLSIANKLHGSWSMVWLVLFNSNINDAVVLKLGLNWLKTTPSTSGPWPQVLLSILKNEQVDRDLTKLARVWLEQNPFHIYFWSQIWLLLFNIGFKDEEFIELAIHWLKQPKTITDSNWPDVWLKISDLHSDKSINDLGQKWIHENDATGPLWAKILTKIVKT